MLDQLDGRLEVVEEAVDVGQENSDVATRGEELGDLDCRDEVAAVGPAGGGRS